MYLVYKHTTPSGKVYIGITGKTAEVRWDNGRGYQKSPYFWRAIQKYGWDNIKHEILHEGLTKEQACEYEKRYIEEYNAIDGRFGYNQRTGGETGFVLNEEVRKRMSENKKNFYKMHPEKRKEMAEWATGRSPSEETRKKMREAHKGMGPTDEHKKKMREAYKRKLIEDEAFHQARVQLCREIGKARSRSVEQIDANGIVVAVYESIKAASRATGINYGNICNVCRGRAKTVGGYGWRYAISDNSARECAIQVSRLGENQVKKSEPCAE